MLVLNLKKKLLMNSEKKIISEFRKSQKVKRYVAFGGVTGVGNIWAVGHIRPGKIIWSSPAKALGVG